MRALKIGLVIAVGLCGIGLHAQTKSQRLNVTGRLNRAMAIGAETSGWTVDLDQPITIEGKQVRSVEINYAHPEQLDKLVNQKVRVRGTITHRQGVETGQRVVLDASSVKAASGG